MNPTDEIEVEPYYMAVKIPSEIPGEYINYCIECLPTNIPLAITILHTVELNEFPICKICGFKHTYMPLIMTDKVREFERGLVLDRSEFSDEKFTERIIGKCEYLDINVEKWARYFADGSVSYTELNGFLLRELNDTFHAMGRHEEFYFAEDGSLFLV